MLYMMEYNNTKMGQAKFEIINCKNGTISTYVGKVSEFYGTFIIS